MLYANSKIKEHIYVKDSIEGETYYCPFCKEILTVKAVNSKMVRPYYSHRAGSKCAYAKDYDMSEWHYQWQEQFPSECREIPMPFDNPVHRADVWIYGKVIEVQHSHISQKDFDNRNKFYTTYLPYVGVLVWIFDMTDHVKEISGDTFKLKKRNDLFKGYDEQIARYNLFFEAKGKIYRIRKMDEKTGVYYVQGKPIEKQAMAFFLNQPPVQPKPTVQQKLMTQPLSNGFHGAREQLIRYDKNGRGYISKKLNR